MKMVLYFIIFISSISICQNGKTDEQIFNSKKKIFASDKSLPGNVISIAKSFLGTVYTAHTLESNSPENLVVNLREFDCTTFVESIIALARTYHTDNQFSTFKNELRKIRYRDGMLNGYMSRLHYFSEWILNNEKRGIVAQLKMNSIEHNSKFNMNFMSEHASLYPKLSDSSGYVAIIKSIEESISNNNLSYLLSKDIHKINEIAKHGDIIAFVTSTKGLDYSHVGFLTKEKDGEFHLLHAPDKGLTVQVSKQPIMDYIKSKKSILGVKIIRLVE